MDRIAIISDIHGNLPALKAVLMDIKGRKVNKIICLGDLAGKGPSSVEVVDLIQEKCQVVLKGNWDHYLSEEEPIASTHWHQHILGKKRLDYLKNLPLYLEFYMSGKLVRLCHASPNDLFHRVYCDSPIDDLLVLFKETQTLKEEADIVGYGDIHGNYIKYFDNKTLFNVGSVGNPLDVPLASYIILEGVMDSKEDATYSITSVRVAYDIERAIKDAMDSDMPEKEAYVAELRTAVYRKNYKG